MIEAILELERRIFKDEVRNKDLEIDEISKEYNVKSKDLEPYFDLVVNYKRVCENLKMTLQNRIVWNIEERLIIDYFVKNTNYPKKEKFIHLSRILNPTNRTKQAISYDYYNNIAPKSKQKEIRFFRNVNSKETEIKNETAKGSEESLVEFKPYDVLVEDELDKDKDKNLDFLSNLNTFIANVKNLNEFNLEEFFQGLTLLSTLAVNNNTELKETEDLRLKVNEQFKLIECINYEVVQFKELDGIDKIGKLEEFTDKLLKLTNC